MAGFWIASTMKYNLEDNRVQFYGKCHTKRRLVSAKPSFCYASDKNLKTCLCVMWLMWQPCDQHIFNESSAGRQVIAGYDHYVDVDHSDRFYLGWTEVTSANWFDNIMINHEMSPNVTMLNWKIFGDLTRWHMIPANMSWNITMFTWPESYVTELNHYDDIW